MSQHRQLAWVEREDRIYLMMMFVNAKDKKFNVDPKGIFTLSGSAGADNNCYELKLELFDKVDAEKSIVRINNDTVFCILMKAEKKWWNKLLRGDEELPDKDDEEAPTDGMDEKSRSGVTGGDSAITGVGSCRWNEWDLSNFDVTVVGSGVLGGGSGVLGVFSGMFGGTYGVMGGDHGHMGDGMDVVKGDIRALSVRIGGNMGGGTGGIGCSCRGPIDMVFDFAGLCQEDG